MKEIFDFKRFALVLKREVATWWKPLLVAYVLVAMLMYIDIKHLTSIGYICEPAFYASVAVSVLVLASQVLANIWTRRRSIATLTLPASATETFAARYLLWLLIPFLLSSAALLIHEIINEGDYFTYGIHFKSWGSTYGLMAIGAHLLMLGGAFFNRKSLLKTAAIGIAGFVLVALVMEKAGHMSKHDTNFVALLIAIVMVIAGIAVSYLRFSRRTINQYKK